MILGLDIGTSSVRAALFDDTATRVANSTVQRTWQLETDAAGRAEFSPEVFQREVEACLIEAASKATQPIRAVATSCFWHSLIGCDAQGRALTSVLTWADSRCAGDAAALRKIYREREVHARTGCMLRPSFWPAKLRWLSRTQTVTFRKCARFLAPAEWLYRCWTGVEQSAHGMATATGCYDPQQKNWDALMLRRCGLRRDQVPTISDAPLPTAAWLAARVPALADALWFPAIGDGAANNLGADAATPGTAAINFGTTAAMRIVRNRGVARAPFGLFCYRIDAQRFVIGGAISNAGGLRQWCVDTLKLPEGDALEAALAQRPAPLHGLNVLPFWLAERAPTWRDDLSGVIAGIRQSTTALDLLQAVTEATYQRLATIAALIPGRIQRIHVGGGLQKSAASLQRLSDVLNAPLTACDEPETSLRGAAVLAVERLGGRVAAMGGRVVTPRATHAKAYRQQRHALTALEARMFP